MAIHYMKGATALVLGLGLAGTAFADEKTGGGQVGAQNPYDQQPQNQAQQIQTQQGSPGAQGQSQGQNQPQGQNPWASFGQQQQHQVPGQAGQQGNYGPPAYGAGIGGQGQQGQGQQQGISAPVPQYWLADAALFTGNALNTAHALSIEQGLNVQAPQVLGNQAQFLLAATNRALSSLMALQQNAEAANPNAVPEIRSVVGHLAAAQTQANQLADAANAGVLGPTFDASVRATIGHLSAAERAMASVGKSYGSPQFAMAGACPTRAFGAGLGGPGKGITPGAPKGGTQGVPKGAPKGGQQPGEPKGGTVEPKGEQKVE